MRGGQDTAVSPLGRKGLTAALLRGASHAQIRRDSEQNCPDPSILPRRGRPVKPDPASEDTRNRNTVVERLVKSRSSDIIGSP